MAARHPAKTAQKQDHRTHVGRKRSARTEARILEAALRVFGEMGPDAPKVDAFVLAAGLSRGTFYNHFESVDELLAATSEWMTRELIEAIEASPEGIEDPVLRYGVGLRRIFARAQSDPVFCRFVARVWQLGGVELPERDLRQGLQLGLFRAPSEESATDLVYGSVRQALLRIGTRATPHDYGDQVTELCLRALGAPTRVITAVSKFDLPSPAEKTARPRAKENCR